MTKPLDWTAGVEAIRFQRCLPCSHVQYFRRDFCAACGASELIEQAASGQGRERLADGHAADVQVAGEVALRRQPLAGVELAGGDPLGQLLLDLHVDRRVGPGPQPQPLAESASAGAHGRWAKVGAGVGHSIV